MSFSIASPAELVSSPGDSVLAESFLKKGIFSTLEQKEFAQAALTFRAAHKDWLYRTCVPGHLTASALVVDYSCERVLLVHHRKIGIWVQPGGHADGDGNLAHVALKELSEETGLTKVELLLPAFDVDIHSFPARGDDPEHIHLDVRFVVKVTEPEAFSSNHEVTDISWVLPDDPRLQEGNLGYRVRQAIELAAAYFPELS